MTPRWVVAGALTGLLAISQAGSAALGAWTLHHEDGGRRERPAADASPVPGSRLLPASNHPADADSAADRLAPQNCDPLADEGKAVDLCPHARAAADLFAASQRVRTSLREADADTDVTHYWLDLEIIPEYSGPTVTAVRVEGVCTIDAQPAVDGLTMFTVDLRSNLTVNSVTGDVGGWSRVGHTIEITLDQTYDTGESFQVVVDYQGYPQPSGFGAFQWWLRNGNLAVATLSEPFYAHYWWPCKDALDDKATMEMDVTVPDWMIAVSNGLEVGTVPLSGNRIQYRWHETYAMMPYLASLAITNYQRYDLQYDYDNGGPQTMPVTCYVYPDHWDFGGGQPYPDYKDGCDELPVMLETLSLPYGQYPFVAEKYGVAETGGPGGLAANMEHQTITSMYVINNYSDIMAHELAHQWWGDEVTCQTWYDIWLNEGFASYSEALYRELKPDGGLSSYWSRMNSRRPSNPDAQVYRTDISSVSAIFSSNDVYGKGAWVMHMLRHVMGDDAFFAALAAYRAAYAHDSATTAEFAAAFSASFGHDLTWFTDQWVMNPGSPDYEWNYTTDNVAGRDYLKLAIWQKQAANGYGLFTMPVDIRVMTSSKSPVHTVWNDDWTEFYVIPLDEAPTSVEFDETSGFSDRNWILFDSRTQVATAVEPPPVLLAANVTVFAGTNGETTVELILSEDVGSFDAADVTLTGDASGSHSPVGVVYDAGAQTATVTYSHLPDDSYTSVVLDDNVSANGKLLDGEVDDSAWWDDTLLPSGDGQPGGDAVLTFNKLTGDDDGDGDVDSADFVGFPPCLTGPTGGPYGPGCGVFDFDMDSDVDLGDFEAFQAAFTGA